MLVKFAYFVIVCEATEERIISSPNLGARGAWRGARFFRPVRDSSFLMGHFPALKRWAIFNRLLTLDPEIGTADYADDADGQAFIANGTLTHQVRGVEPRWHPQILSSVPSASSAVIFIAVFSKGTAGRFGSGSNTSVCIASLDRRGWDVLMLGV
jgi:hypothetical protein